MIEVQSVNKSFDGFQALDNLSMTVPAGSIYGLVGPNVPRYEQKTLSMLSRKRRKSGLIRRQRKR